MARILKSENGLVVNNQKLIYYIKYGRSTLSKFVDDIQQMKSPFYSRYTFSNGNEGQFNFPGSGSHKITDDEYNKIKQYAIEYTKVFKDTPNLKYLIIFSCIHLTR